MSDETITNEASVMKYFGAIPHMVGAKIDLYAHRLYCHYVEVCGINKSSTCTQAEKTIYTTIGMSKQRFHTARQSLIDAGFITFIPGIPNAKGVKGYAARTSVIDIWAENIAFCQVRGKNIPLEGEDNYPLKGSDITPSNKYKNLKEEKDSCTPESGAQNADGDNGHDARCCICQNVLIEPKSAGPFYVCDPGVCDDCNDWLETLHHDTGKCSNCENTVEADHTICMDCKHGHDVQSVKDAIKVGYSGGYSPICDDCGARYNAVYWNISFAWFCDDCYKRRDDKPIVADLVAATPKIPPQVLDDTFMGTRNVPVIPTDADWTHDAPTTVKDVEPKAAKTKRKKAAKKQPSEHTLMKNAMLAAMGKVKEEITAWGDWNSASKKLRAVNAMPEDIQGLYNFVMRLSVKGGWAFTSPMALAKYWPDYKKQLREIKATVEQQDDSQPLDPSAGVVMFGGQQ